MHADRFNRFALLWFGLVVLVAGAAAMAMSVGLFGTGHSHLALFDNFISRYIGAQGQWFWPAAAALGLIVALGSLRWILTLLVSTDRSGDMPMPGERRQGRTIMKQNALTAAVTTEIETYRGVATAKARTIGDASSARMVVDVGVLRGTDVGELAQRIDTEAFPHTRQATGRPDMRIRLNLTVSSRAVPRL